MCTNHVGQFCRSKKLEYNFFLHYVWCETIWCEAFDHLPSIRSAHDQEVNILMVFQEPQLGAIQREGKSYTCSRIEVL